MPDTKGKKPKYDITKAPKLDPRSRRRCPCGFEGSPNEIMAHRHGWKKRPECRGKIINVWTPSEGDNIGPSKDLITEPQEAQEPQQSQETQGVSNVPVYEYLGTENEPRVPAPEADAEAVAKRLTEELHLTPPEDIGGDGHRELVEGDFQEQPPVTPPSLTPEKQTLEVPPVILVWYNWARDQGWFQGDGSISAFVTDCLLDHFRHCWGYRVVIVSEEEVSIIEQARS
jgi:hypothetical protein